MDGGTPSPAGLFVWGEFTSHAGKRLDFKIDADALAPLDLACLAHLVAGHIRFDKVVGIPRGGLALAKALEPYTTPGADFTLIVDDVLTTGRRMQEEYYKTMGPCRGLVIFARGPCPYWITPIFQLHPLFFGEAR